MDSSIIAYLLIFGIPGLILGFGAYVNEFKASSILAYINLIVLLTYFTHAEIIPQWIIFLVLALLSVAMGYLYKGMLGGGN